MGKATKGNFYTNGRRKQPTTKAARDLYRAENQRFEPNDRVQARRALFAPEIAAKPSDYIIDDEGGIRPKDSTSDAIGQLWLLDFLDGNGYTAEELRDVGRRYAGLYWTRNAAQAPKGQTLVVVDKSKRNNEDTRSSLTFEAMIRDLPTYERSVLELVVCDYWFTDDLPPFVERLVTTELLKRKRLPPVVRFEESGDRALLAALVRALCVVHEATIAPRNMQRRAA